jgi:KDO2-lipid IV(A) lauroyltransferase
MSFLIFALVYPFVLLLSKLPFRVLYIISDVVFLILYYIVGYRRDVVLFNLKTAFPEMDKATLKETEKRFYHHFCDLFIEVIKTLSISEQNLRDRYLFTNIEVLQKYVDKDQPVLVTMGHYASYEWVFALATLLKNHPGYAIYKKIKNPYFDKMIRDIRSKWNSTLVPNKQAREKIKEVLATQKGFAYFGFIMDQSPSNSNKKHFSNFLNVQTPFFTGVEKLSKQYDLPVLFLGTTRVKRGYYSSTFSVLTDTPNQHPDFAITDAYAKILTELIIKDPAYYFWTHKRFKFLK